MSTAEVASMPMSMSNSHLDTISLPTLIETDLQASYPIDCNDIGEDKSDAICDAIARYGDACSTDWLDYKYKIWTAPFSSSESLYVQGYMLAAPWVFAWGSPACPRDRLEEMLDGFTAWCEDNKYSLVYLCVDESVKEILTERSEWNILCCVREDVVDPMNVTLKSKDLRSNTKLAIRNGVTVQDLGDCLPPDSLMEEVNQGIKNWQKGRGGMQVASDSLDVWLDHTHRRYFIASDGTKIVGVCNLARFEGDRYQIKNSITFPGAPKGTSELMLQRVIEILKDEHVTELTFGGSAAEELVPIHNLEGWKLKFLAAVYKQLIRAASLTSRHTFRRKFGTFEKPLYIAFPNRTGLTFGGIMKLMHLFTSHK